MTQISAVMTRGVRTLSPRDSVVLAAQAMEELDVGSIPICDGERLVGIVTDRDIVLRAVARDTVMAETQLETVMSERPCWCFIDQSTDEVMEAMREAQLRRMPVVDRDHHLVGIVSLGDLAVKDDEGVAAATLEAVSEPARPRRGGPPPLGDGQDDGGYAPRDEAS